MPLNFAPQRATKKNSRLKMGLIGLAGSGKTYTALSIATNLIPNGRVLVIDTEHGSASKYADLFEFDVVELDDHTPTNYAEAIHYAVSAGYDAIVLDSLSHAWNGSNGALEQVDNAAKRAGGGGNAFGVWRNVTPLHNAMIQAIVSSRIHLIATMRSKMDYVQEKDAHGKTTIRKVGLAPVQRDGMEYEFDVVADLNQDNEMVVSKSRCPSLTGKVFNHPGADVAAILSGWLSDGTAENASAELAPIDYATYPLEGDTNDLRDLLAWMKESCPTHPQKRELVEILKARAAESKSAAPTMQEAA